MDGGCADFDPRSARCQAARRLALSSFSLRPVFVWSSSALPAPALGRLPRVDTGSWLVAAADGKLDATKRREERAGCVRKGDANGAFASLSAGVEGGMLSSNPSLIAYSPRVTHGPAVSDRDTKNYLKRGTLETPTNRPSQRNNNALNSLTPPQEAAEGEPPPLGPNPRDPHLAAVVDLPFPSPAASPSDRPRHDDDDDLLLPLLHRRRPAAPRGPAHRTRSGGARDEVGGRVEAPLGRGRPLCAPAAAAAVARPHGRRRCSPWRRRMRPPWRSGSRRSAC